MCFATRGRAPGSSTIRLMHWPAAARKLSMASRLHRGNHAKPLPWLGATHDTHSYGHANRLKGAIDMLHEEGLPLDLRVQQLVG